MGIRLEPAIATASRRLYIAQAPLENPLIILDKIFAQLDLRSYLSRCRALLHGRERRWGSHP